MDPWIGNHEIYVTNKCNELLNDTPTEIGILSDMSDEEWRLVADAIKKNESLTSIRVYEYEEERPGLSISAAVFLAGAAVVHRKLEAIAFHGMSFTEFNAISSAFSRIRDWCDSKWKTV